MVRQSTMPSGGWSMAAPIAWPRNGALHGVEMTVAKAPDQKEPA